MFDGIITCFVESSIAVMAVGSWRQRTTKEEEGVITTQRTATPVRRDGGLTGAGSRGRPTLNTVISSSNTSSRSCQEPLGTDTTFITVPMSAGGTPAHNTRSDRTLTLHRNAELMKVAEGNAKSKTR